MIKVDQLSYTYPKSTQTAVKAISFQVEKGEIFGFLGPSGAGKSTTQKVLIRLLDNYQGSISLYDKALNTYGSDLYEKIGVGFELPNHFLKLSGEDNLKFFASLYGGQKRSIEDLMKLVGLYDAKDQAVASYSKGMKMRLNFIRALLHDPEIIFLDEPTSGLDPVNAKLIKELILEEKAKGKTIFITTHNMQVADDLCDRVAFIVDGEIVELDTPKALKLKHGERLVQLEYVVENQIETACFDLESYGSEPNFLRLIKQYETRTLHSMETTLEDVFIKVTGRRLD